MTVDEVGAAATTLLVTVSLMLFSVQFITSAIRALRQAATEA